MTEVFFSVDVETSGPTPGLYDLLTVGVCLTSDPSVTFYRECQPVFHAADPAAMAATGLDLNTLAANGRPCAEVMAQLAAWVEETAGAGTPVFVGFNAAFDWSFVNYAFHRFLGRNPFGFAALDIKSLYLGVMGGTWRGTRMSEVRAVLQPRRDSTHHALDDALAQAEIFEALLKRQTNDSGEGKQSSDQ